MIWEIACRIDELNNKISNATDVLELIADDMVSQPHSGALWLVRDVLNETNKAIELLVSDLMHEDKPKGKKK
jgi:hypothetical protein